MEPHSSKFVLAVQEGHPTYMGFINPKDASDRWIFNQLKRNHDIYQFKHRDAYNVGVRIWKRYKSNLRRGKCNEWILSRYQGLVEPLGYDADDPLTESAVERIRRDYSDGISERSWPLTGISQPMPSNVLSGSGKTNLGASRLQSP